LPELKLIRPLSAWMVFELKIRAGAGPGMSPSYT
jgi:hypothetical protein